MNKLKWLGEIIFNTQNRISVYFDFSQTHKKISIFLPFRFFREMFEVLHLLLINDNVRGHESECVRGPDDDGGG